MSTMLEFCTNATAMAGNLFGSEDATHDRL